MDAKLELLKSLEQIISEQLGVVQGEITETSTWLQLGADSLDRMGLSMAIEDAFEVVIPHPVGERLDTVGETVDHLSMLIAAGGRSHEIKAAAPHEHRAEL